MRFQPGIIEEALEVKRKLFNIYSLMIVAILYLYLAVISVYPQNISIVAPEGNSKTSKISEVLSREFSKNFVMVDETLSRSIFGAYNFDRPFNLSTTDAENVSAAIGCNFLVLINSGTYRRTSFEREKYFESFATFFLVSARSGRLIFWKLSKFEEDSEELSEAKLFSSLGATSNELATSITAFDLKEISEQEVKIEELSEAENNRTKNFRPPMPYRRLKPEYTAAANLYKVLATVDVAVDIDANGNVLKTEVLRWAGYGLDESVIEVVKKMQWRPADRDGKPLAMRILLRYNFENIETDD